MVDLVYAEGPDDGAAHMAHMAYITAANYKRNRHFQGRLCFAIYCQFIDRRLLSRVVWGSPSTTPGRRSPRGTRRKT